MCVDQCAMKALESDSKGHHRQRRSPMNCANKLRSVPACKTLTQMQYKNSPDQMEIKLNFRTGDDQDQDHLHHNAGSAEHDEDVKGPAKFPLLSGKTDEDGHGQGGESDRNPAMAPFKRAKPPFVLKHKKKKKHRGKHHHSSSDHNHHDPSASPPPQIVLYGLPPPPFMNNQFVPMRGGNPMFMGGGLPFMQRPMMRPNPYPFMIG